MNTTAAMRVIRIFAGKEKFLTYERIQNETDADGVPYSLHISELIRQGRLRHENTRIVIL